MTINGTGTPGSGRSAAVAVLALALGACVSTPRPNVGFIRPQAQSALGQDDYRVSANTVYRLRSGDVITVTVLREPELSSERLVLGADGTVQLPVLGPILAAGLTTDELQQQVTRGLARTYLVDPSVAVNIGEYGSHLVTVEGSVEKPGVYSFRPGQRLSAAMSLASGPKRTANLNQVAIFRPVGDAMTVALFDYGAVRAGRMIDPVIEPGDRVVVGTNGLSQTWQDLLATIPVLAVFLRF